MRYLIAHSFITKPIYQPSPSRVTLAQAFNPQYFLDLKEVEMKLHHYLLGSVLAVSSASGLAADFKNPLSVHVLNLQTGVPTAGIKVELDRKKGNEWIKLADRTTNADGRIPGLYPADQVVETGVYRVIFMTGDYYKKSGSPTFFPEIPVIFTLDKAEQHYHIPLLLSQFGYSTYRGN